MEITMKEVREEIDLIDKKIVLLLSQRQKCIEKAAYVKKKKSLVVDNKRIDEFAKAESLDNGKPYKLSKSLDIPRSIKNLPGYSDGLWTIQDRSSQ